jgi:hypothetical protein
VRQHGQNADGREQKHNNLGLVHESVFAVAGGGDPISAQKSTSFAAVNTRGYGFGPRAVR